MSTTFLSRTEFKTHYGVRIYIIASHLEKLYRTQIQTEEHLHFLRACKVNDVTPKGLRLKDTTSLPKNSQLLQKTERLLRNNLLEAKYRERRLISSELKLQEQILLSYLETEQPNRNHQEDLRWMNKHDGRPREKMKMMHEKKLSSLLQRKQTLHNTFRERSVKRSTATRPTNMSDTSNVVNLSDISLATDHLRVLSKGLKFVPTPSSLNVVEMICSTEKALYFMTPIIRRAAVAEITTFAAKWRKSEKHNLSKDDYRLLRELKSNDQLIVVPADKGGKVVVMNRKEYTSKVEEKLNDRSLYQIVKDPTKTLKRKISEVATRLFRENKISELQKYNMCSIDNLAYARAQPKLHKDGTPMRIITCTRATITSGISRYTFNLIRQLRKTVENCVMNTVELLTEISQIQLEEDDRLISLDVCDMFNNIDTDKAIDIIVERIEKSEKFAESNLTVDDLRELMNLCLKNSYFTFNSKVYQQRRGLPMGNILSPLISDVFMHDYLKENIELETHKKFWRYVDDILMKTKMTSDQLNTFVKDLNVIEGTIRFTNEYEVNGSINFLDTTLTRNTLDKTITVQWFRKETASDRLLNFESCHQASIKRNLVKNMAGRVISTTKDSILQQQALSKLKTMLCKSNYPVRMIDKLIQDALRQHNNSSQSQPSNTSSQKENEVKFSLSLPYYPGIEALKRRLERFQIKLYFSYGRRLSASLPSNINPPSRSVVYELQCTCGESYVGETKVGLKQRMSQHKALIEKASTEAHSEIVQHHYEKLGKCMFDPSKAIIIDNETDYRRRKIKEAIYSEVLSSINRRDKFSEAWAGVLSKNSETIRKNISRRRTK